MTETTEIAVYDGVNFQKAAYYEALGKYAEAKDKIYELKISVINYISKLNEEGKCTYSLIHGIDDEDNATNPWKHIKELVNISHKLQDMYQELMKCIDQINENAELCGKGKIYKIKGE